MHILNFISLGGTILRKQRTFRDQQEARSSSRGVMGEILIDEGMMIK
jgi:hypothetical protein